MKMPLSFNIVLIAAAFAAVSVPIAGQGATVIGNGHATVSIVLPAEADDGAVVSLDLVRR